MYYTLSFCDLDLRAGVRKRGCDTPSSDDANMYQVWLKYLEQIRSSVKDERTFKDGQRL